MTRTMPADLQTPPVMIPQFPPAWAEVFGEDDFGVFAGCSVKDTRFVWRWIPPGRFRMGSPKDEKGRREWEGPQHEVTISRGFWLGETPVTQAQWEALVEENPSEFKGEQRPVEKVSWHDSVAFTEKVNTRFHKICAVLPTEAQWEYACRAGTHSAFNDGSVCIEPKGKDPALDRLGWFAEKNSDKETKEVKLRGPNAWGLYDMHGNVWEWCRDAWDEEAYRERKDGEPDPEILSDDKSALRVIRGGSWDSLARDCRAAFRDGDYAGNRWSVQGLRLAAGQEQEGAERPSGPERRSRG